MEFKNNRATPKKDTGAKNGINLDYDYNTEYGDGDIPEPDKNCSTNMNGTRNDSNTKVTTSNGCNSKNFVVPNELE
ncbi:MAG: hypothetical protein E7256_12685 [Lachnospiraceae bacterium]|nr:hypothetical protein [Lachnospiraceae bacterium]